MIHIIIFYYPPLKKLPTSKRSLHRPLTCQYEWCCMSLICSACQLRSVLVYVCVCKIYEWNSEPSWQGFLSMLACVCRWNFLSKDVWFPALSQLLGKARQGNTLFVIWVVRSWESPRIPRHMTLIRSKNVSKAPSTWKRTGGTGI